MKTLVTGAEGSIGSVLVKALNMKYSGAVLGTDLHTMDVTDARTVGRVFTSFEPAVVFHLAGAKHAPLGEEDPWAAANVNILGTRNVLRAAKWSGARVITASTCKACNPETAYGATKLIAERMTLNAGGSVARFYNVRESSGNVFEIWRGIPTSEPIPVTPCERRFMSVSEAVRLLLRCVELPPGRYSRAHVPLQRMSHVAKGLYPGREITAIPPRRGDRRMEPAMATQEKAYEVEKDIWRIVSAHDQSSAAEASTAATVVATSLPGHAHAVASPARAASAA
jgi:FlaA1/EpsC-like NDP-sugar epimerase